VGLSTIPEVRVASKVSALCYLVCLLRSAFLNSVVAPACS
jgi:hypothetical protein